MRRLRFYMMVAIVLALSASCTPEALNQVSKLMPTLLGSITTAYGAPYAGLISSFVDLAAGQKNSVQKGGGQGGYYQPGAQQAYTPPGGQQDYYQPGGQQAYTPPGGQQDYYQPGGQQAYTPPGGQQDYYQPGAQQAYTPPGGQQDYYQPGGQQAYTPPGGQQDYNQPGGQQDYNQPGGQQAYTPPGGQQAYTPPGGQQDYYQPGGQQAYTPPGGQQDYNQPGGQQAYTPPGGQQDYNQPGGQQAYTPPGGQQDYYQPGGQQAYAGGTSQQRLEVEIDVVKEDSAYGRYKAMSIKDGDTLTVKDNYKVAFQCNMDCYAYVVQLDSTGKMDPIFPNQSSSGNNPVAMRTKLSIPQGEDWFYLDNQTGVETIYFIVSKTRRTDLEELFNKLSMANKTLVQREPFSMDSPFIITRGIGGVRQGSQSTVSFQNGSQGDYSSTLFSSISADMVATRWFHHK